MTVNKIIFIFCISFITATVICTFFPTYAVDCNSVLPGGTDYWNGVQDRTKALYGASCSVSCSADPSANYGYSASRSCGGGRGAGCSTCSGCNTPDGCGMYNILGVTVAKTSPTSARISWIDTSGQASCAGDGGDVHIFAMTDPNALYTTASTCHGLSTLTCGYDIPDHIPNCWPNGGPYPAFASCPKVSATYVGKDAQGHKKGSCTDNFDITPGCSFILEANWYSSSGKRVNHQEYTDVSGLNPNTEYYFAVISSAGHATFCPTVPMVPIVPFGTIHARAWKISDADLSCNAVYAAAAAGSAPLTGSSYTATDGIYHLPNQTQTSGSYSQWQNVPVENSSATYTLAPTVPVGYLLRAACHTLSGASGNGTGLSALLSANQTLSWDLGYTLGAPWVQTGGGGDVFATTTLRSSVSQAPPSKFMLAGAGGYPGVASYGTTRSFDVTGATSGDAYVSATNWLAHDALNEPYFYPKYLSAFGGWPTAGPDYTGATPNVITQPAARSTPYFVNGNVETSGDWLVPDGQKLIFIVSGSLTISGKINVAGSGIAVFIVQGDISVDPTVGGPYTSSAPVVEGVYVSDGTFHTGKSTNPGTERFVGKGTFIANDFELERDLETVGQNNTTSSELFLYNPRFLVTMPEAMKNQHVDWQEVAP